MAGLLESIIGQRMGLGLLGAEPVEPEDKRGFWQGGDKFTGRDALAGLLASVGDGLQNYYGGDGNAMGYLQAGRLSAAEMAREKAAEQEKMQQTMAILQQAYPNLNDAQRLAMATNNGNYSDFKPKDPKGLRPVAGPTGVFVWDADNERFVPPPNGGDPRAYSGDEWEDIPDPRGGGSGNAAGGFR